MLGFGLEVVVAVVLTYYIELNQVLYWLSCWLDFSLKEVKDVIRETEEKKNEWNSNKMKIVKCNIMIRIHYKF